MNAKQLGIAVVLADFAALTAYAVYQYGYLEFFRVAMTNAITIQLSIDLVIALSLITLWMWRDARERGMSVVPYLVVTLFLGSLGPLLYLLRRAGSEATETVRAPANYRAATAAR